MTEERRLLGTGMPLEDVISMCYDLRREGTLSEFIRSAEQNTQMCLRRDVHLPVLPE